ncbi:glucose/arabinose dehydrogenase [Saccharopolyspora erythraea NRRL 2338]|uniref:Possible glucose dehydrogenase n=2 Tax=Saccharopolyspora erythraea TaxID=1836 RepID=A4FMR3_SACEN|nr:PQQ-dependent sugar dehydrogenase [Saccharopolyspora erythraea]EQD85929.1 glucose dehydrogenase [Saccharopolyspora erythraea D]PFG98983.1 glucose/arabinose dehydrogenase [Saccharopolyspora erythraea NRRL 2338]QRK93934.1 PQQ-dependent sugar dehydrogenase [Saccharopolyspora erythraea]CAM05338.1 possible glucose dehydrogenase [Saccharopolyspora erythraea NRRL 2338]
MGAVAAVGALLAGCAQFPDEHTGAWKEQPSLEPQTGPQPSIEGEEPPAESVPPQQQQQPQANGCHDPDPAVVATCLDPIGAVVVLPDGQSALVGERATGRVLRVQRGAPPVELARIPVNTAGGGGLTGLALSPTYHEDELFYAYVTTGGDNQVVRVAPGDRPKPVLTGIPRGGSGNGGALIDDGRGALLVATGNAGNPANAANPTSLAGKVLRIDGFGKPAPGNPDPASPVLASGLSAPGGLCAAAQTGTYWVTDRGGPQDALYQIRPGQPLGSPAWTWPDRPGVAGCVASPAIVVVALSDARAMFSLNPTPEGAFTGQPTKVLENTYGRFSSTALGPDGLLWAGTANKAGGQPEPSDDRVVRIEPPTGGTAGKD